MDRMTLLWVPIYDNTAIIVISAGVECSEVKPGPFSDPARHGIGGLTYLDWAPRNLHRGPGIYRVRGDGEDVSPESAL